MIPRRVYVKIQVPFIHSFILYFLLMEIHIKHSNNNNQLSAGFVHSEENKQIKVTPMLLYKMVSIVRSGLCSKWSLYEVT